MNSALYPKPTDDTIRMKFVHEALDDIDDTLFSLAGRTGLSYIDYHDRVFGILNTLRNFKAQVDIYSTSGDVVAVSDDYFPDFCMEVASENDEKVLDRTDPQNIDDLARQVGERYRQVTFDGNVFWVKPGDQDL